MKILILFLLSFPALLLAQSIATVSSTSGNSGTGIFVQDHHSNNYTSVFRLLNLPGSNQAVDMNCDPGIDNPCQEGFRCQEFPNDLETQRRYPGLYKTSCIFRRTCLAGQKSPRVLCEERCQQTYDVCHREHPFAGGSDSVDPCLTQLTTCRNTCLSEDPKCSYIDSCVQTNPADTSEVEPRCSEDSESISGTGTVTRDYLGSQHQECDSNRCLKYDDGRGLLNLPSYCVPIAKCVPICIEEGQEARSDQSCCAGFVRGSDNRCHSPDFIEEVPTAIISEVDAGGSCRPHLYEFTDGVKNPDETAVALRMASYERFLLGFEFIAGTADNIKDQFGINQEVMSVGQTFKNGRIAIQSIDNANLATLNSISASLTQVASGMSFYRLLLEENRILRDTDRQKAQLYADLITPLNNAMTYNMTRQWNKFTDRSKWIEIGCGRRGCFIIRLNDSICGKYIYSNKYCVKNCWATPDRKIIDPILPRNLGKLSNMDSANQNYKYVLGATSIGTSGTGFIDQSRFTKEAMELALNNNVVAGMAIAAAIITPAQSGGFLGGFLGKFSRPRYTSTNNFDSTSGMKQLQDTFILSYADYAMGSLPGGRTATETTVTSMASEFEMKIHIAQELYQKNLANLNPQEMKGLRDKLTELKGSSQYDIIRRSLALAETGKKAFEFFRLYGKANSCIYEGEKTKGLAIDALLKRVMYLANFYQASAVQREMMVTCLENLINGTLQPSYEAGTSLIGGGVRNVRTGTITPPPSGLNSIDTTARVSISRTATNTNMNKIDFSTPDFGSNLSSSANISTRGGSSVSSGSFNSGNVGGATVSYGRQAIGQRLEEMNKQAKASQKELEKTTEGRTQLAKLKASQASLDDHHFTEAPASLADVKATNQSLSLGSNLSQSSVSSSGTILSKDSSSSEGKDSSIASGGISDVGELNKFKDSRSYSGGMNFDSKKGAGVSDMENSSATMSAENLTGLNTRDTLLISDGLKNEMLKYKSVPGDENDSLFKIVTKAYFRVAYPIIFKKDDGIKKEEKK